MSLLSTSSARPGAERPRSYIPTPQEPGTDPIFISNERQKKPLPVVPIVIATIVIIVIIALLTLFFTRRIERGEVITTVDGDLVNLDALFDLRLDGQCCVQPSTTLPTKRYIYSPSKNFSYSTDITNPDVVCQGLGGTQLQECLNMVSDENGDPKPIAHRDVTVYYGFSNGNAGSVCSSYATCPD